MIKCIIIEDEDYAASYLKKQLLACNADVEIEAVLDTVEDSVIWLKQHNTELIFSDVQLGDGLSFEIFDHIQLQTPIIFTTSFDKYAIKAFEQNSIAYLLKPIKQSELLKALSKHKQLYLQPDSPLNKIAQMNPTFQEKFIVQTGHVFQNLFASDIAYFRLRDKRYLFIHNTSGNKFMYDSSLELLETRLNPIQYFRINRQIIINRKVIKQAKQIERGRFLLITEPELKEEELVVSIGRAKAFKEWFNQ
jgi:DNA-binding LytR/AlgR family response regulator